MLLSIGTGTGEANGMVTLGYSHSTMGGTHLPAQMEACAWPTPADCEFAAGYLESGGPVVWLRHLIEDVRPCEGNWYVVYDNSYVSAFQFAHQTWANASAHTGATDPLRPYDVGRNVGWLVAHTDPGGTGGWKVCWWRGSIP